MLLQMEDLRYVSIAARVSTYFAGLWVRPRHTLCYSFSLAITHSIQRFKSRGCTVLFVILLLRIGSTFSYWCGSFCFFLLIHITGKKKTTLWHINCWYWVISFFQDHERHWIHLKGCGTDAYIFHLEGKINNVVQTLWNVPIQVRFLPAWVKFSIV